jgi:hypothetical protein
MPTNLSNNNDCGKNIPYPGSAIALGWRNGAVRFEVTSGTKCKGFNLPDSCGEDQQTGITDALLWAWPLTVRLSTAPLPQKWILMTAGGQSSFTSGPQASSRRRVCDTVTFGEPKGTVTNQGANSAIVRLIRQPD